MKSKLYKIKTIYLRMASRFQTRIDWTGFHKLRNEETNVIEAAKCKNCDSIFITCSDSRFEAHR